MIILGIDPGFERLGIAILSKEKKTKEVLIFSECFKTSKELPFIERLGLIGEHTRIIIKKHKPNILAIEKLYITNNQKTAMYVAEARGVIMYECARAGLKVLEYTPPEIKVAVTGYGKADKKHIATMVSKLIALPNKQKVFDDEIDAIAVALTAMAHERL